ncbi:MAG: MerR family transcriptional regulator [Bacteroidetes bacterium]|nr:MerR family transcriptional regulator [Bacteroidota bacterium]
MEKEHLIALQDFCISHQLDFSFIESLQQYGLIEITTIEQSTFIRDSELSKLEQITRLHDLDINLEGIEAITNLLEHVEKMQHEITRLKNKLSLHESSD